MKNGTRNLRAVIAIVVVAAGLLLATRYWYPAGRPSERLAELATPSSLTESSSRSVPSNSSISSFAERPDDALIETLAACTLIAQLPGSAHNADPSISEHQARQAEAQRRLALSRDPEHIYSAVLVELGRAQQAQRMSAALIPDTSNVLLAWHGLNICSRDEAADLCPLPQLENRLLDLDSQNGEAWARVAANRLRRGETDAALDAMQHAASAAEARVYWPETIEMLERAFAATSDLTFTSRALWAIAGASASSIDFGLIRTMCKEQSAVSDEWARACLAYGALVERRQETEIGRAIGLIIQQDVLETLGADQQRDEVAARLEAVRRDRDALWSGARHRAAGALVLTDQRSFSTYLNAIRQHGEYKAWESLQEEATARLQELGSIECPP